MSLTGGITLTANDLYTNSETREHPLGAVGMDKYGDLYRYAKVGGDESAGTLLASQAESDNHQNIAVASAASAEDNYVEVTVGATAVAADEYVGGMLHFVDTSPEGESYRIRAHETSSGSEDIKIYLDRPLKTAATTSSEVALTRSIYFKPDTTDDPGLVPAGVVVIDVDYSEKPYTWLKTRGSYAVLGDTAGAGVQTKVTISDQIAGAVGLYSDVDVETIVGKTQDASTAGEYFPVYLMID